MNFKNLKITIVDDLGVTPATVDRKTGEIFWSKKYDYLRDDVKKFIIFHEIGHYMLDTQNEFEADEYAFNQFVAEDPTYLNKSLTSMKRVFTFNNEIHFKRLYEQYKRALNFDYQHNNNSEAKVILDKLLEKEFNTLQIQKKMEISKLSKDEIYKIENHSHAFWDTIKSAITYIPGVGSVANAVFDGVDAINDAGLGIDLNKSAPSIDINSLDLTNAGKLFTLINDMYKNPDYVVHTIHGDDLTNAAIALKTLINQGAFKRGLIYQGVDVYDHAISNLKMMEDTTKSVKASMAKDELDKKNALLNANNTKELQKKLDDLSKPNYLLYGCIALGIIVIGFFIYKKYKN